MKKRDLFFKYLSYIWPMSRYVQTPHNGRLEIMWYNGKKVLNSQRANYSYGLLQEALEVGLKDMKIPNKGDVLLLGLGGGCVLHVLKSKKKHQGHVDAVEIDETIIELAAEEFGIKSSNKRAIYCMDAYPFLLENKKFYDIIIVDIFIDDDVPKEFYGLEFHEALMKSLSTRGQMLINLGMTNELNKSQLDVIRFYENHGESSMKRHDQVMGYNTLLVVSKS